MNDNAEEQRKEVIIDGFDDLLSSDPIQEWSDETGQPIEFSPPDEQRAQWEDGFERYPDLLDQYA